MKKTGLLLVVTPTREQPGFFDSAAQIQPGAAQMSSARRQRQNDGGYEQISDFKSVFFPAQA
jgi:hypothetical protein